MKLYFFTLLFVLNLSFVDVFAQGYLETMVDVTPPNVQNFKRFNDVDVNKATGKVNYNVELFAFALGKGLKIPVTLNYRNDGFKPKSIPSWVGHGWELNVGGFIIQEVNGHNDLSLEGLNNLQVKARMNRYISNQYTNEQKYDYKKDVVEGKLDAQYDVFNVKLPNDSYSFYVVDDTVKTSSFKPYKTTVEAEKITVINDLGYTFVFDLFHFSSSTAAMSEFGYPGTGGVRVWYLTKIVAPDQQQIILEYRQDAMYNVKTDVYSYYYGPTGFTTAGGLLRCTSWLEHNQGILESYSTQYLLKKISFGQMEIDFETVERNDIKTISNDLGQALSRVKVSHGATFIKQFDFRYSNTKRLVLNELFEVDQNGVSTNGYRFTYYEGPVGKISEQRLVLDSFVNYGIDHWGYLNGAGNNQYSVAFAPYERLLPSYAIPPRSKQVVRSARGNHSILGMLKEVETPTKGIIRFTYEPNGLSYDSISDVPSILRNDLEYDESREFILDVTATCPGSDNYGFKSGSFIVEVTGDYSFSWSFQADPLDNIPSNGFSIRKVLSSGEQEIFARSGDNTQGSQSVTLEAGNYKYFLDAGCEYEEGFSNVTWLSITKRTMANIKMEVGGNRISRIDHLDKDVILESELFSYEQPSLSNVPEYISSSNSYAEMTQDPYFPSFTCAEVGYTVHSNNLNTYLNSNINYGKVTWTKGAGKICYYYGNIPYTYGNYTTDPYPAPFELDWRTIAIRKEEIYRKEASGGYQLTKKSLFEYSAFPNSDSFNNGIKFRRNYRLLNGLEVRAEHNKYFIESLVPMGVDRFGLVKRTEVEYHGQDSTVLNEQTEYSVENFLPTKHTLSKSDGGSISTINLYPEHYADDALISSLKRKNIINGPIETVRMTGTSTSLKILFGTIYNYNANGQIIAARNLETQLPVPLASFKFSARPIGILPPGGNAGVYAADSRYKIAEEILRYDGFSNPIEVKRHNGLSTVYLWGYGAQYPVAKIENATYQEVLDILGQTTINSLNAATVADATINTAINTLRNHANMKKALVSTFTYKPLAGMASMTDPRGITEYYKYDGFQRLKDVLDFDQNILKNYRYHYRP
ncbi:hypothetical protein [Parapedobacter tibetensis]|uniref:hypothetical protein n=1 Tax=Parapedobacter tibetensis TaxID=2972951 RepID=UPI00214D3F6F|nr:hypothetical protein [Parapedobacter tibetensis]